MSDESNEKESAAEPTDEPQGEPQTEPQAEPAVTAPVPQYAARRLVRRREGKILGGVCTGVAAYFGVDPVLVRVGFVLATILGGGSGLLVYIVMWLVMPM